MLKKIAAYGAVMAGAAGFALSAVPAQAQTVPATGTQLVSGFSGGCDYGNGVWCEQPRWRALFNLDRRHDFNKRQRNASNNGIYACDVHIIGLDHILIGRNEENAKCAQTSFNDN